MRKWIPRFTILSTIVMFFIVSTSFAQTFFGGTKTNVQAGGAGNSMSPDEFDNLVKQMNQQNQAIVDQKLNQLRQPVATPPTSPSTPTTQTTPAVAAPIQAPAAPPSVYTGFGSSPGSNGGIKKSPPASGGSSGSSSGGFNINY